VAVHEDERLGDVRDSWADVSRIAERLGFAARTRLADGLERTIESLRGHRAEGEGQ
jgi:nucleoside-diphosphate-sugar epimerase